MPPYYADLSGESDVGLDDDLEDASVSGSLGGGDGGLLDEVSRPGRPFPSDEYISLLDGLNQVALSNYAPQQLSACLKSARRIISLGDRFVVCAALCSLLACHYHARAIKPGRRLSRPCVAAAVAGGAHRAR